MIPTISGQIESFHGETVTASSVLVRCTYGGGFNYDGKINVDDYGIIDAQGAPIPMITTPLAGLAEGVTAVPEPASVAPAALMGAGLMRRRRNRGIV